MNGGVLGIFSQGSPDVYRGCGGGWRLYLGDVQEGISLLYFLERDGAEEGDERSCAIFYHPGGVGESMHVDGGIYLLYGYLVEYEIKMSIFLIASLVVI